MSDRVPQPKRGVQNPAQGNALGYDVQQNTSPERAG